MSIKSNNVSKRSSLLGINAFNKDLVSRTAQASTIQQMGGPSMKISNQEIDVVSFMTENDRIERQRADSWAVFEGRIKLGKGERRLSNESVSSGSETYSNNDDYERDGESSGS